MIEMIVRIYYYAWIHGVDQDLATRGVNQAAHCLGEISPALINRTSIDCCYASDRVCAKSPHALMVIASEAGAVSPAVGDSQEIRTRCPERALSDNVRKYRNRLALD